MFRRTKHSSKRTRLGRPTPAMAVACTALFMALGGVGYAAATVGSSQIKNNSVQGKDIKNSTIKTADISKGTRNSLKGQTGPAGSNGANGVNGANGAPGATGLQGPIGPRGPSNLRVAADSVINLPQCTDNDLSDCGPLLSRTLTTGSFLIQAKFTIDNDDNAPSSTANVCGLLNGFDTTIDRARTATLNTTGLPGEIESVSLSGVSVSPNFAQTISLRCTSQAGEVMDLDNVTITALQVESVVGP